MTTLDEALKEAYASVSTNPILDTLEISHPNEASIYLVRDRQDFSAKLETGEDVVFFATGFNFTLPGTDDSGVPELSISIDNVDQVASDFIRRVKDSQEPVTVFYRPYLSSHPQGPQMDPPLRLQLRDVKATLLQVTGRATFADVRNKQFLSQLYTRRRFPSLR